VTVTCIRVSRGVSGSTRVRVGASSTIEREHSSTFGVAGSAAGFEAGASVTTVLRGTTSTGRISTATCSASWRESPKKRGSTSCRFASVITRATRITVERQRRPSRRGSRISGNRPTSRAATWR
jgi:hypothetical protein